MLRDDMENPPGLNQVYTMFRDMAGQITEIKLWIDDKEAYYKKQADRKELLEKQEQSLQKYRKSRGLDKSIQNET